MKCHFIKWLVIGVLLLGMSACARQFQASASPKYRKADVTKSGNSYYFYTESQLLRKQGQFDQAMDYLRKAIERDPESVYLKKELILLYIQNEDDQNALKEIENLVAEAPDDVEALTLYGRIQQRMKNLDAAKKAYAKIIKLDPQRRNIYMLYGQILIEEEDYAEAAAVYEKLVSNFPRFEAGYFVLGRAYSGLGKIEAAERAFTKAHDLRPGWQEPLFELANLYKEGIENTTEVVVEAGDTLKSLALKAYQRYTNSIVDVLEMYNPRLNRRTPLQAGQRLQLPDPEVVKMGPEWIDAQKLKVVQQYAEILRRDSDNPRAMMELGLFYHHTGEFEQAQSIFESLGAKSQENFDILIGVTQQYLNSAEYDDTIVLVSGMLEGAPDNSNLHYLIGLAYYGKKQNDRAINHFKQVGPDSRFFSDAVAHVSFLYQEAGEITAGIDYLQDAIGDMPNNAQFYYYLGTLYEEQKNYAEAEKALKKGIELEPENAKLLFRLGVIYDKWDRKTDSMATMKDVIRVDPKHANALNYLGYTYADLGQNLDEAERLIKLALKYKPDDGYITDSLGWVYYKKGLYSKALGLLEKAVELVPNDPTILEHLGDAYLKTGNKEKAMQIYLRSLKEGKEDRQELENKIKKLRQEGF